MAQRDSEALFGAFLESLGADPTGDPRLVETPRRFTDLMERFLAHPPEPELGVHPFEGETAVVLRGIRFYSICEHHLLPFFGTVDVAYQPQAVVAGFGGIQRCVDHFATRLQLQERLTNQVADSLFGRLAPAGLAVVTHARQLCFEMTGGSPEVDVTATAQRGAAGEAALGWLLGDSTGS